VAAVRTAVDSTRALPVDSHTAAALSEDSPDAPVNIHTLSAQSDF